MKIAKPLPLLIAAALAVSARAEDGGGAAGELERLAPRGVVEGIAIPEVTAAPAYLGRNAMKKVEVQNDASLAAQKALLNADRFVIGGEGFAGTISEGEKAFKTVMVSPKAKELLLTVLDKGTNEGKLYALIGLRFLDPDQFHVYAKPLMDANPQVWVVRGCIVSEEEAKGEVGRIFRGWYAGSIPQNTAAGALQAVEAAILKADGYAKDLAKLDENLAAIAMAMPYGEETAMNAVNPAINEVVAYVHTKSDYWTAVRKTLLDERRKPGCDFRKLTRGVAAADAILKDIVIDDAWLKDRIESSAHIMKRKTELFELLKGLK